MTLNIQLSLRSKTESTKATERVKAAGNRKKAATETIEEAWARILAMKNSDADQARLIEIKAAMAEGLIGRDPSAAAKRFSKAEALRLWRELAERQREDTLRRMVEETPANYWLITDKARLNEFLALLAHEEEIVFDVETTGVDIHKDYIVGHVITAVKADVHAYIPTKHDTTAPQLPHDYVTAALKPFYEDASIGKLAHNAKFDIHMLANEGVTLRGLTWDTQEAMRMLNENEPTYALKPLVDKYLHIPSYTYSDLFGNAGFHEVSDLRIALAYAAKDGDVTLKMRDFQRYHLSKMPTVLEYYETVEVPLTTAIVNMERVGYDIDLDFAAQYGAELRKDIAKAHAEVVAGLGDINLNSPVQLKEAIEKAIGQKIENTDAKRTLKPLANKHPIIKTLLDYRRDNKLYTTYINALPELIDVKTGKLYTNFNQNGAKTGRFSSGGGDGEGSFNMQNQPKDARKLYVAPAGWVIVGADFSAQEIRCLANLTREPLLLEAFREGKDPYATVAADYFGKTYEECYKLPNGDDTPERKQMKTVVLASIYGTSKYGLADQLGITTDEAQAFLDKFFAKFTYIKRWIDETHKDLRKTGFVWIGAQCRKRRLPAAVSKIRGYDPKRNGAMRQGPNARVQGESAIQTKKTLVALDKICAERGWKPWAQVHDEILLLLPENFTREDITLFERTMTQTYLFGDVSNKTDIEIMTRWGAGVSVDDWFKTKEAK